MATWSNISKNSDPTYGNGSKASSSFSNASKNGAGALWSESTVPWQLPSPWTYSSISYSNQAKS